MLALVRDKQSMAGVNDCEVPKSAVAVLERILSTRSPEIGLVCAPWSVLCVP